MFNGRTALNLDAKGRLTVPTRYRESLNSACGGRLVLTQHPYDACLVMYPFPEWR
ncbi:MAG TPA: division/cell wall cluster transcriptional repressor MraZ, partial [Alcanivorax sp.]|nr:division/cell wall cluster transcriptional repressor MraZ [Alcanivorax sp.]